MKIKCTLFTLMLVSMVIGCSQKKPEPAKLVDWPEMDLFHLIMVKAYHPFKDSANLEPAKVLAEDLAREAENWASAPLPDSISRPDLKPLLDNLREGSRAFASHVASALPDKQLGAELTALHETYHKITETWSGKKEDHDHPK